MNDLDSWCWEYDPDEPSVITNIPLVVVTEAEKVAEDLVALADLGIAVTELGTGPRSGSAGGVRRFDLPSGGWVSLLPLPRDRLIVVVLVMPPVDLL